MVKAPHHEAARLSRIITAKFIVRGLKVFYSFAQLSKISLAVANLFALAKQAKTRTAKGTNRGSDDVMSRTMSQTNEANYIFKKNFNSVKINEN